MVNSNIVKGLKFPVVVDVAGSSPPPQNLNLWLLGVGKGKVRDPKVFSRIPHDVYVIGTQESALTDKDWINTLKSVLKSCFMIEMETVSLLP